ncbi:hypothetical protein AB0P32_28015, partial [Streptomyces sp. NPDC085995]|uniref:hypothetical protein n=1 Tax=Streptomyces sp. NPDC085995 TaxID=3154861 RepID=UPI003433914D
APGADREFSSSFEAGDPAPDWLNTVDTTPGGLVPRDPAVDAPRRPGGGVLAPFRRRCPVSCRSR